MCEQLQKQLKAAQRRSGFDPEVARLKKKLDAAADASAVWESETRDFRKALEYLAEYVSDEVFDRCLFQGRKYAHEDGIVGEVTWSRRGAVRPVKEF